MSTAAWFPYRKDAGDLELISFAHAGAGSAAFGPLRRALNGTGVKISPAVLPGRERRLQEEPYRRMETLLADFEELARADGYASFTGDYGLLGHCSGALVAYEIARILERSPCPDPRLLVVCSCLPPPLIRDTGTGRLPTERLLAETSEMGGTPMTLFDNKEMVKIMERPLRADWVLFDGYEHSPSSALRVPIFAVRGAQDADVTAADLVRWGEETTGDFLTASLDAGHWVLTEAGSSALAREIPAALAAVRGARR
jgi:surfactin synthase thioesterase subunit